MFLGDLCLFTTNNCYWYWYSTEWRKHSRAQEPLVTLKYYVRDDDIGAQHSEYFDQ